MERKALAKIYKKVMICKLCKEKYGSDIKNDNGHCSDCSLRGRKRKAQFKMDKHLNRTYSSI